MFTNHMLVLYSYKIWHFLLYIFVKQALILLIIRLQKIQKIVKIVQ